MTNGQVKTSGEIARRWWTSLQPARERGYRGDPGALARLRRASLIDAMTEPVTVRLHRELGLTRVKLFLAPHWWPAFSPMCAKTSRA
jgi:hypothetical protein